MKIAYRAGDSGCGPRGDLKRAGAGWAIRTAEGCHDFVPAPMPPRLNTVARAAEILDVSNPTARQAVGQLQAAGMLKEVSGRKWGQLYLAGPILKAIEQPA